MRNASSALLILMFSALLALFSACQDSKSVVVRLPDVAEGAAAQVDPDEFREQHHYWCGYKLRTLRPISLSLQPTSVSYYPPINLPADSEICVVDINVLPSVSSSDSVVWVSVIECGDSSVTLGWIPESELLSNTRPTHFLGSLLSVLTSLGLCESLADVPGGSYSHAWLEFYFHPTLNPWTQPPLIALFLILLWTFPVVLVALIDRMFVHRARYRCGHCGGILRRLGTCPHCGSLNEKP